MDRILLILLPTLFPFHGLATSTFELQRPKLSVFSTIHHKQLEVGDLCIDEVLLLVLDPGLLRQRHGEQLKNCNVFSYCRVFDVDTCIVIINMASRHQTHTTQYTTTCMYIRAEVESYVIALLLSPQRISTPPWLFSGGASPQQCKQQTASCGIQSPRLLLATSLVERRATVGNWLGNAASRYEKYCS